LPWHLLAGAINGERSQFSGGSVENEQLYVPSSTETEQTPQAQVKLTTTLTDFHVHISQKEWDDKRKHYSYFEPNELLDICGNVCQTVSLNENGWYVTNLQASNQLLKRLVEGDTRLLYYYAFAKQAIELATQEERQEIDQKACENALNQLTADSIKTKQTEIVNEITQSIQRVRQFHADSSLYFNWFANRDSQNVATTCLDNLQRNQPSDGSCLPNERKQMQHNIEHMQQQVNDFPFAVTNQQMGWLGLKIAGMVATVTASLALIVSTALTGGSNLLLIGASVAAMATAVTSCYYLNCSIKHQWEQIKQQHECNDIKKEVNYRLGEQVVEHSQLFTDHNINDSAVQPQVSNI
jgi:hypothetical protein